MSDLAQTALATLKNIAHDPIWDGKQNSWIRRLDARALNEIGGQLALQFFGGKSAASSDLGYNILRDSERILVRVATQSKAGGKPFFLWRNIRPSDPFTHIAFIAILPSDVRVFLIDKDSIPALSLRPVKGSPDVRQVHTSAIESLRWLVASEIE